MFARDLFGGLAVILLGGVYLYFAFDLRFSTLDDSVGPGGLPRAYGWAAIGLGTILCIQAIFRKLFCTKTESSEGNTSIQPFGILRAAGLFGIGVGYLVILDRFGYLVSIALLLLAVVMYQGGPRSSRVVWVSLGGAAVLWIVFTNVFGVPTPSGRWIH